MGLAQVVGPVQTPAKAKAPVPFEGDALFAPLAVGDGPETAKQRFEGWSVLTFGPRALVSPAFAAGFRMAHPKAAYPKTWKDGGGAFGRNYGDALASKAALETGRFATAALLHEDFRYRPSTGRRWVRVRHAIWWTFEDQSNDGQRRFAFANVVGAAAGGFTGNAYLPPGFDNVAHAGERSALRLGLLALENVDREFAPEIVRVVRKIHLPLGNGGLVPEWWVRVR
jgi:hypothetical protein